jgi:hypothetical protein
MHWQAENHHELLDSHCGSPNAFENRCRRFSLLNGTFAHRDHGSLIMVYVDFDTTRLADANDTKIFGTADRWHSYRPMHSRASALFETVTIGWIAARIDAAEKAVK